MGEDLRLLRGKGEMRPTSLRGLVERHLRKRPSCDRMKWSLLGNRAASHVVRQPLRLLMQSPIILQLHFATHLRTNLRLAALKSRTLRLRMRNRSSRAHGVRGLRKRANIEAFLPRHFEHVRNELRRLPDFRLSELRSGYILRRSSNAVRDKPPNDQFSRLRGGEP